MSEPITFISRFRVKEGKRDALRELFAEVIRTLEATKPRTVCQLAYLDEDDGQLSIVHIFPDGEAMAVHFEGADERSKVAYEFMVPGGWEIYGPAPEPLIAGMRRRAEDAGVELTLQRQFVGGFLRPSSG